MFDLNNALTSWRRPFLVRHWYSRDEVAELESHLTDSFETNRAGGMTESAAFQAAVRAVGDERELRDQYLSEWKGRNPFVRYWRLIAAESAAIEDIKARVGYRVIRAYSLWVGLASSIYLSSFFVYWYRGASPFQRGVSLEGQGLLFLLLWGMLLFFNLAPFRRWRNSLVDQVRVTYSALVVFFVSVLLYASDGIANISETFGLTVFVLSVISGPALWAVQAFARKENGRLTEDLSTAS